MALTDHQVEVLTSALEILLVQRKKRLLISGSAGVGKTFMVNSLISEILSRKKYSNILCSAPTHKALAVLKSKITAEVNFQTVHSALQYKAVTNLKTGEREFKPVPNERNPPLRGVDYFIIDEASMIGIDMLFDIEKFAEQQNTTVIFIGDSKQINPVGEVKSPAFLGSPKESETGDYLHPHKKEEVFIEFTPYPEVELTEIIRQGKGSPIIDLSRNISGILVTPSNFTKAKDNSFEGFLWTNNFHKIIESLAEVNGTDKFKYLAWTNAEVDRVNNEVRRRIYGDPQLIEPGETLVFNAPYDNGAFHTNEELFVEEVLVEYVPFDLIVEDNPRMRGHVIESIFLKCFVINPWKNEFSGGEGGIYVLHPEEAETFKKIRYRLNANCKAKLLDFRTRNAFYDNFADMKYNHALTIHKSQGSTYETAVVNVPNIFFNKDEAERSRLLYTAVTRASSLLILYK